MATSPPRASELKTSKLLIRLWRCISPRRRKQVAIVSLLMVFSALAEAATLGIVIPFVMVLVEPERVFQIGPVEWLAGLLNVDRAEDFVVPLALLFVFGILVAMAIRVTVLWAATRVSMAAGSDLDAEAYKRTLYQPYSTHTSRNASDVTSGVIHKIEAVVLNMLYPAQIAFGATLTIGAVTAALVVIDPLTSTVAMVGFGGGYFVILRFFRGRLIRNSELIAQEQNRVVKAIQEGTGGIRDILIDGTQAVFLDQFRTADRSLRRAQGSNAIIAGTPRVAMECIAMLLVSGLAVVLSGRPGGVVGGLPVLGALALGGQRLLPLYQQFYTAATQVLGQRALLGVALEFLEQPLPATYGRPLPAPLDFHTDLKCEHLRFRYSPEGPWVIDNLDLTIAKGSRVGLVGTTGCGKSTLLDLLMGLLVPSGGKILVDGKGLEGNHLAAWQQSIAHVPQHIFLADASLAENIAFGVTAENINMERVHDAARRAIIAEFAENEPMGYATVLGERGVRLSGGQRQRVGIARALYKQASVLVFDEATSALDNQTEQSVISGLADLDREITSIIVAHRLSTLKDCDVIVELSGGQVVDTGPFDRLMSTSATFRDMAQAAEEAS